MHRTALLILCCFAMAACRDFPELEVSEARFDNQTPYPDLVPVADLLNAPEPTITEDLEQELTGRAAGAQQTSAATPPPDPLQNRIDALRARRDDAATRRPVIDDSLRNRLESGIVDPGSPE